MIEEIKQIISDNSEEKHFVEYGKGVFATEDAVDEIAESVVKLFSIQNVSNCENPHCEDGVTDEIYGEKIYCSNCENK